MADLFRVLIFLVHQRLLGTDRLLSVSLIDLWQNGPQPACPVSSPITVGWFSATGSP